LLTGNAKRNRDMAEVEYQRQTLHTSALNNQQSAISNQQSTINNQQSTINNQQSAISNQHSTINIFGGLPWLHSSDTLM
jgi:hypothetical protein